MLAVAALLVIVVMEKDMKHRTSPPQLARADAVLEFWKLQRKCKKT